MPRRMVGGKHPQASYKGNGDDAFNVLHIGHVLSGSVAVEGTRSACAVDGTICLHGNNWVFCNAASRSSCYRQSPTGAPTHGPVRHIQSRDFLHWSRTLVLIARQLSLLVLIITMAGIEMGNALLSIGVKLH